MKKISDFLYGSEPLKLQFDMPIETATERLNANVHKSSFMPASAERMEGNVDTEHVEIERVIPLVGNAFKPVFVGKFSEEGGKTILTGVFRFHRFVQVFMTFWFGITTLWLITVSINALSTASNTWYFPLYGLMMLAMGVGMVKIGKWFSRNDRQWLKEHISHAIAENV